MNKGTIAELLMLAAALDSGIDSTLMEITNPYAELRDVEPPTLKHGKYAEVRTEPKIGRNEPCPCESGKKYKKCCINKD